MNKNEICKDKLLRSRIIVDKQQDETKIRLFYNEFSCQHGINELPLLICSTLQRKTCLVKDRHSNCVLFLDTTDLECYLDMYFANLNGIFSDYIRGLIYQIIAEQAFILGQYSVALFAIEKCFEHPQINLSQIYNDKDEEIEQIKFVQLAFILGHDGFHYYLTSDAMIFEKVITLEKKLLRYLASNFSERIDKRNYSDYFCVGMNIELLEECSCDNIGALSALDFMSKRNMGKEIEYARIILNLIECQYILEWIKKFVNTILVGGRTSTLKIEEFLVRSLSLESVLLENIKSQLGDNGISDFFDFSKSAEIRLNEEIEKIFKEIWNKNAMDIRKIVNGNNQISLQERTYIFEKLMNIHKSK